MKQMKQVFLRSVYLSFLFSLSGCAIDRGSRPLSRNHPANPSAVEGSWVWRGTLMTNLTVFTSRPSAAENNGDPVEHAGHGAHKAPSEKPKSDAQNDHDHSDHHDHKEGK